MKALSKIMTGAAVAALTTVAAATPAQAQYRYDRHYDRDGGIDAGDIIAGVAILGGIAAVAAAIGDNDDDRYDNRRYGTYGYGYGHQGYGEGAAINACRYEAARYGRGEVRVTDVDRRGSRSYRVRGVIDGYGGYDRGRYDRYGYDRIGFECDARENGQITDFDTERYR
jgi:hypothetical protein